MNRAALLCALPFLLCAAPAEATYSIAATDSLTREVGGAGASCVGRSTIYQIYGSVPGHGVVHAQALFGGPFRRVEAERLLAMDVAPSAILEALTDPTFDPNFARRQYGIADLSGRAAGFTGESTLAVQRDIQGTDASFTYSVQGNILTGEDVLTQMQSAFVGGGCDLADRLMLALEAGGGVGRGDSRCVTRGIPADGAFIQVDRPEETAGSYLLLRVDDAAPSDPIPMLRTAFDAWRVDHPCPALMPDAGVPDAGVPDAGVSDAGVSDGGASDGGVASLDADLSGLDASSSDAGGLTTSEPSACGCRAGADSHGSVWFLLPMLALLARRAHRKVR